MHHQSLGPSGLCVPRIALGAMRYHTRGGTIDPRDLFAAYDAALECGINLIDHADIYGRGEAETVFGRYLAQDPGRRGQWLVQTKVAIRPPQGDRRFGCYDFSRKHIVASVDGSLKRLGIDSLEVLLLHRPDALMEPEDVAAAFDELATSGKVRHFGLSNANVWQMELLRRYVQQPLCANQLAFGLGHPYLVTGGLYANRPHSPGSERPNLPAYHADGLLEYCRLHDITLQPYSPLAPDLLPTDGEDRPAATALAEAAASKGLSPAALQIAWILTHPAQMQPIIGTTQPGRLREIAEATTVTLTREEWYDLLQTATGQRIP